MLIIGGRSGRGGRGMFDTALSSLSSLQMEVTRGADILLIYVNDGNTQKSLFWRWGIEDSNLISSGLTLETPMEMTLKPAFHAEDAASIKVWVSTSAVPSVTRTRTLGALDLSLDGSCSCVTDVRMASTMLVRADSGSFLIPSIWCWTDRSSKALAKGTLSYTKPENRFTPIRASFRPMEKPRTTFLTKLFTTSKSTLVVLSRANMRSTALLLHSATYGHTFSLPSVSTMSYWYHGLAMGPLVGL